MKKVSIILPTYNGAQYIKVAIESVIKQSFLDWELIVWDDGSTDNTKDIVGSFLSKNNNIFYFKNDINLGIQKTLNLALAKASGIYIARIDDDDEWCDTDKLKKQIDFLDNNSEYVLVGVAKVNIVDVNHKKLFDYKLPEDDIKIRNKILSRNCFVHTGVVFQKSVSLKVGNYNENLNIKNIEDYDLWLKLGLEGKFCNIDSCINFMARDGSITSLGRRVQALNILKILPQYKNKYPKYYYGYFISFIRFIFFKLIYFIPINQNFIYKIQSMYKSI